MKRYAKKQLEGLDDFEFASLILQERVDDLLNPYSPLLEKLRGAIHTLKEAHDRAAAKPSDSREELFRLMRENPELPVVPMVDGELAGDDFGRWLGKWGSCSIGKYIIGEERVHFFDGEDWQEIENTLTDGQITYEEFDNATEAETKAIYEALPWVKAIIVDINTPE